MVELFIDSKKMNEIEEYGVALRAQVSTANADFYAGYRKGVQAVLCDLGFGDSLIEKVISNLDAIRNGEEENDDISISDDEYIALKSNLDVEDDYSAMLIAEYEQKHMN